MLNFSPKHGLCAQCNERMKSPCKNKNDTFWYPNKSRFQHVWILRLSLRGRDMQMCRLTLRKRTCLKCLKLCRELRSSEGTHVTISINFTFAKEIVLTDLFQGIDLKGIACPIIKSESRDTFRKITRKGQLMSLHTLNVTKMIKEYTNLWYVKKKKLREMA